MESEGRGCGELLEKIPVEESGEVESLLCKLL